MRFTIERIRTLVIVAGVLLVVALAAFLAIGKWKNPFSGRDIPKRLGIDIEQEANGVTYTQAHAGHTIFKIHASKVVQLKNSHAMLHDVQIELYGIDGSRVDRIVGDEFEYDQKGGMATAAGPVVITLMRPGIKPAIASEPLLAEADGKLAHAAKQPATSPSSPPPAQTSTNSGATQPSPASGTSQSADTKGQIQVKTSGLVFNQQTGVATTSQQVNFSSAQGTGSSMGASYESQKGFLVLNHQVELTTQPSATGGPYREPVKIHADHAEFERDSPVARLHVATAKTATEQVTATDAQLLFRDDGSVVELDASNGFTVATATGGHLAAPTGILKFDEDNHPRAGHLEGGVQMDSTSAARDVHGSSSTADLEFTPAGDLHHAHLQQAVEVHSQETAQSMLNGKPVATEVSRTWRSSAADVDFRKGDKGQLEPASIHGASGVIITSESRRGNEPPVPSKLAADEVSGVFGPDSALTSMTGTGHASMEETTANGAHETATGDRLEAHFSDAHLLPSSPTATSIQSTSARGPGASTPSGAQQIQSAVLEGHVVLIQQPAPQAANTRAGAHPQTPLRATAGKAEYEGAGELLHLTLNPRVNDGGLQLTADKVDVAQASGDAFAHGNVKATWSNMSPSNSASAPGGATAAQGDLALGGKGPAHVIAAEAELHQATGEATFRGHARLWQDTNSVAAPTIVLDREKQTLTAKSADPAEPVRVVMVSAGGPEASAPAANAGTGANGKTSTPSVIRVRGGDLWYSGIERMAFIQSGALGPVTVETGSVESSSNQAELFLTPAGNGGNNGAQSQPSAAQSQPSAAQSQVDHMTASGHVLLTSQGRRGTGEQLAYTGRTGDYVLTGTAAAPPRMTDPIRGTVTGEALIFHSRDDSVNVEGGAQKTMTETTAPK